MIQQEMKSDWSLRNVRETAPSEFKAVVRGPKGKRYLVGTFGSKDEAEKAINDLINARWHG